MTRVARWRASALAAASAIVLSMSGCTGPREYVANGFKVGPNYCPPEAPVAERWIDAADPRVRAQSDDLARWWAAFNDPVLDRLMEVAYRQNLTLRQAGYRVLEARAQFGIAQGAFFPQLQNATGSYRREGISRNFFDQWNFGFNLAWELDFWGRFRRAIDAAEQLWDASADDYDFVLVTLLADVAANYVQIRTDQQRIALLEKNVKLQEQVRDDVSRRLEVGRPNVSAVDLNQATSNLMQTKAQIPQLEADLRQANNRLAILLGMPPVELQKTLDVWKAEDERKAEELRKAGEELQDLMDTGDLSKTEVVQRIEALWKTVASVYVPTVPKHVAAGIPAELLRRRPDVREAEHLAAAQGEQIGIAEAALYPAFSINGMLGYQAAKLSQLFSSDAFTGSIGPSFQWNLLNYGRIVNNVRLQDAKFQELVTAYQDTVLVAHREVEDGLVTFLRAQERAELLASSARAGQRGVVVALVRVREGGVAAFNQYAVVEQGLVQQEDLWAQSRGEIALGLIEVYRALGGGWEIRLAPEGTTAAAFAAPPAGTGPAENAPMPAPNPFNALEEPPAPPQPAPEPGREGAKVPPKA